MNKIKRTTLIDRIKNAIRSFKGTPIGSIQYGLDIKRCDECEYKDRALGYRDNLLVIAGARAAYMDSQGVIDIPEGTDGEDEFSYFILNIVDYYNDRLVDVNFDEYIEVELIREYGGNVHG